MSKDLKARYRKAARAYLEERGGRLIPEPRADPGSASAPWSDAWLMLAIRSVERGGHGAALEDILACGDAINHAGFTPAELSGGFDRLESGGFIAVDGAECRVTEKFKAAWAKARGDRLSLSKSMEAVRKIVGAKKTVGWS